MNKHFAPENTLRIAVDIGGTFTDGVAALSQPTSHYMTTEVIFDEPGETVAVLMGRMTDRRVRHLPVLRERQLAGVVSIGDVVKCQIAEAKQEAESLRTYIAAG